MTIIPENEAAKLGPGDVYEVGRGGPFLVVRIPERLKHKKTLSMRSFFEGKAAPGIVAIPLRHPRTNRPAGAPCWVVAGDDESSPKRRADDVGFEPSSLSALADVSPGTVFSAPMGNSEVLVVRDSHGSVFLLDGSELDVRALPPESAIVETFDIVTDITPPGDEP